MNAAPLPRPGSGLVTLALIVTLVVLPFTVASGLHLSGWRPARTGNHGTLLSPPRPLPAAGLQTRHGEPLATAELHGKWLLVLAGHAPCAAECAGQIDEMQRIQVSLNKHMGRLRRVVLTGSGDDRRLDDIAQGQPDLLVAVAPPGWLPGTGEPADAAYRLYIADPQGNLMMAYSPDVTGKAVRADLERLLRFAWSG